jgi:hypothetical protein
MSKEFKSFDKLDQHIRNVKKQEKEQKKSILEAHINDIFACTTVEAAKELAIQVIEESRINNVSKRRMLLTLEELDNLLEVQKYMMNAMLKRMGLGVVQPAGYRYAPRTIVG